MQYRSTAAFQSRQQARLIPFAHQALWTLQLYLQPSLRERVC